MQGVSGENVNISCSSVDIIYNLEKNAVIQSANCDSNTAKNLFLNQFISNTSDGVSVDGGAENIFFFVSNSAEGSNTIQGCNQSNYIIKTFNNPSISSAIDGSDATITLAQGSNITNVLLPEVSSGTVKINENKLLTLGTGDTVLISALPNV